MGIILAIVLFSLIVFFHELGHFLLAKKNGINVEEFSIGMGPTLVHMDKGGTRYSVKLLPLGGSCMMGEDNAEDMSEGSFNSKSVWARISVIAAGPVFNFILAFIFSMIIVAWMGYDAPVIGYVVENSPAEEAGLRKGDEILSLNGKAVTIFRDISVFNQFEAGKTADIVYKRDGKEKEVTVTPRLTESGAYQFGIGQAEYKKPNVWEVFKYGAYEVKYWIEITLKSLKMLVTGGIGIDQLSGPVGIVDVVGESYEANKSYGTAAVTFSLLNLAILLSANLGVMNLLPIPALDGGRLVFLFAEAIRGKRVPPEKEGMVHFAGLILLFALMIFVMYNDIQRLFI